LPIDADTFLSRIDGVSGTAILKKDGSLLAAKLPQGMDAKEVAKKALGLMDASKLYAEKAGGVKSTYAVASGSEGVVAVAENRGLLLVCILAKESDIDSAAAKVRRAAEGLQELA
jgi:predicted regulator of Ras-like GTPase activity (Roadblock/LC7/MglB family)